MVHYYLSLNIERLIQAHSIEELEEEIQRRISKDGSKKNFDGTLRQFNTRQIVVALKKKQEFEYGRTSSKDYFEITDKQILNDAESVVAIFRDEQIKDNTDGTSYLETVTFGEANSLCQSEKYRKQPIGAFCTGVLVASDVIATTGHCINSSNLHGIRFIFGFKIKDTKQAEIIIDNSEIYEGKRVIGRTLTQGLDWALVQLNNKVTNHNIAKIRISGIINNREIVHVIGHPCGLPLKIAEKSFVINNSEDFYFNANLNSYGGNAGSPIFNTNTHEVEGIIARGETRIIFNGDCFESLICPDTGCNGVECTRTTAFSHLL